VLQLPTSAVNVTLPAFAAERRAAGCSAAAAGRAATDISCPQGAQQQTRRTLLSIEETDSSIDPAPDTTTTVSVTVTI